MSRRGPWMCNRSTAAFTASRMSSGLESMARSTPRDPSPAMTGNFRAVGKRVP